MEAGGGPLQPGQVVSEQSSNKNERGERPREPGDPLHAARPETAPGSGASTAHPCSNQGASPFTATYCYTVAHLDELLNRIHEYGAGGPLCSSWRARGIMKKMKGEKNGVF